MSPPHVSQAYKIPSYGLLMRFVVSSIPSYGMDLIREHLVTPIKPAMIAPMGTSHQQVGFEVCGVHSWVWPFVPRPSAPASNLYSSL